MTRLEALRRTLDACAEERTTCSAASRRRALDEILARIRALLAIEWRKGR